MSLSPGLGDKQKVTVCLVLDPSSFGHLVSLPWLSPLAEALLISDLAGDKGAYHRHLDLEEMSDVV